MSEKEFSLEQSEDLIANLKSGKPSEFEHLRSALNLLAHVPEISPVSTPPVLPSTIAQPTPLIPIRSSKQRRTIVTSIIVVGLFASGSLAAAAVTGIGPSIIVNAGHSAAKFVRSVVGGVGQVVTGNSSASHQNQASGTTNSDGSTPAPANPNSLPTPALSPAGNNNENDTEQSPIVLPLVSNILPPLALPTPTNSSSHENESQVPNSTHETQGPSTEDSHQSAPRVERTQTSNEDQNQSESHPVARHSPEASPTAEPTSDSQTLPTAEPSILPTAEPSVRPTGSSDDSESEN